MSVKCIECERLRARNQEAFDRYIDFYEKTGLLTEEAENPATPLWSEWIAAGRALDKHERTHVQ